MNTDKLKDLAAPTLAKAKEEQNEKIEAIINLVGALCDSVDDNLKVNKNILKEKKKNHKEWHKAANRRFYILVIGAATTAVVGYLDVLQLNDNSQIAAGFGVIAKAVLGWF